MAAFEGKYSRKNYFVVLKKLSEQGKHYVVVDIGLNE